MTTEHINKKVFARFEDRLEKLRGKEIDEETKQKINQTLNRLKQGIAQESEVVETNKLMTKTLENIERKGHVNDIVMGKPVMDAEGNKSSNMSRTVIVLDNNGHITYVKSGMDNHSILAGKYFKLPGRHSFWYEYSGGNLVLHPAASEDKPRLDAWIAMFDDKKSGLKEEIKRYLQYFT